MSSTPKRTLSVKRSFEKVGEVLHLHRESSRRHSLSIPSTKHGCRSEEEVKALRQLMEELQNRKLTLPPDMVYAGDLESTLLRFLRARKYDIPFTIAMLEGCIAWRKDKNIDKVLHNPLDPKKLEVIRKHKPSSYIGFDKLGRPIYVDRVGQLDVNAIYAAGVSDADVITYHIQEMEYMGRVLLREASERAGHTVDSVVMILDVSGLRLSALTGPVKTLFRQLVNIDQNNYPETNGGTNVVHASLVFTTVWGVLKPFLDKNTASKVQVLGSGKKAEAHLTELFGRERLPTFLGGDLDFDSCRKEWAIKMDAALEEVGRKARELEHRKELRHSSSRTPSLPGTPVSRSPSIHPSDTVAAAAAIADAASWKARRHSSGSQASTPIAASSSAPLPAHSPSPTPSLTSRTDSRGPGPASLASDSFASSSAAANGHHRPASPFGGASTSSNASAPGTSAPIPPGLAPIRLERVSAGSEYEDADSFYTPKSNLSRSSSSSSMYADATEVQLSDASLAAFTAAAAAANHAPPAGAPPATPTRSDSEKAAAINAKDKDVTDLTPTSGPHHPRPPPSELGTIDEQRIVVDPPRKQPGCKCTIM